MPSKREVVFDATDNPLEDTPVKRKIAARQKTGNLTQKEYKAVFAKKKPNETLETCRAEHLVFKPRDSFVAASPIRPMALRRNIQDVLAAGRALPPPRKKLKDVAEVITAATVDRSPFSALSRT